MDQALEDRVRAAFSRKGFSPAKVKAKIIDAGDAPYELHQLVDQSLGDVFQIDVRKGRWRTAIWMTAMDDETLESCVAQAAYTYKRAMAEKVRVLDGQP